MKYLIISDIHGSLYYLKKALNIYKKSHADKIIILGDILYHGPRNNLPKGYAPKEVAILLNSYKKDIICIQGNCDAEVDQMVLDFPLKKKRIIEDDLKILLTHGHKINPDKPLKNFDGDVVLFGHTHIHEITKVDNVTYINPGSISIPKGDGVASLSILEGRNITIYDLSFKEIMKCSL